MGIADVFRRTSEFDANTMVTITDGGKHAFDEAQITNLRQYAILDALDDHSPRSLSDLAKEAQLNINVTKSEIIKLKRQKMVKMLEE